MVARDKMAPQLVAIGGEHPAARERIGPGNVSLDVVPGMELERRVTLHADIADAEKHGAGRLTDAFDAEALAARVELRDYRRVFGQGSAFAETLGGAVGKSTHRDDGENAD